MVKNLPATWEAWVQPLGREDCLEKGMAAHSSIFAWRIPWTEEPRGLQSMGLQNLDSVLKSRDITLPAKVRIVKAMVFPVTMYNREGREVM